MYRKCCYVLTRGWVREVDYVCGFLESDGHDWGNILCPRFHAGETWCTLLSHQRPTKLSKHFWWQNTQNFKCSRIPLQLTFKPLENKNHLVGYAPQHMKLFMSFKSYWTWTINSKFLSFLLSRFARAVFRYLEEFSSWIQFSEATLVAKCNGGHPPVKLYLLGNKSLSSESYVFKQCTAEMYITI